MLQQKSPLGAQTPAGKAHRRRREMNSTTVLLLSGGLDSVAALHHTRPHRAVGFSYGQPHRDAELTAAGVIAARRGVPFDVILLPDLRRLDPTAGRDAAGVSLAFPPLPPYP